MKINPITNCYSYPRKIVVNYASAPQINFNGSEKSHDVVPISETFEDIIRQTNSKNFDLAKVLIKDKNIETKTIPAILQSSPTTKQTNAKLDTYNKLKDRKDVKKHGYSFALSLLYSDYTKTKITEALASNPKFSIDNISCILAHNINSKENESLCLKLINENEMSGDEIQSLIDALMNCDIKLAEKVCFDPYFSTTDKINLFNSTYLANKYNDIEYCDFLCESDLHKLYDNYNKIHQTVLKNPKIYINGDENNSKKMAFIINKFFERNMAAIMGASYVFDMKTINDIMRMRLDSAEAYLGDLVTTDLKLLKALCNSNGIDGKPLSFTQKIEMLNIIIAYKNNNMPLDKIEKMAENGKVDINKLNSDLLKKIFSEININISNIPKNKFMSWDLEYLHLLAEELKDKYGNEKLFKSVIYAANSERSFKDFIQDPTNEFGYNNKSTMLDFKELKIDYDKWVNPDKKNNVHFVHKDENKEKLSQISNQIEEDINTLLHSMDDVVKSYDKNPIRKILYNSFGEYMIKEGYGDTSDRFVIPKNLRESKTNITKLVEALSDTSKEGQLTAVWNNAKNNLNNPQRQARARNTLMILNHLEQKLKDLENADRVKTQNLDLTIKMWDRVPQKDLFQGNYSTCCIGMGATNGWSMPVYLLNTAFNMIELVDNNTGKTVGNALCYFVKSADTNEPVFIIDNIEIKNSIKPSDEVGKKLRAAIIQYAKNITKDLTKKNNVKILLGTNFNDIPVKNLKKSYIFVKTLGKELENEVYTDAIDYTKVAVIGENLYKLG